MKRKRILALFLAAVSCLSLAVSASAAGTTTRKATDFKDYDRTAWYAEAVSAAVDNGLLYGKSATVIDPNGDMTRAEMAAIINRSFGCYKAADISQYKDVSKNKWYYKDVALAVQMGTYNGRSSSSMAPDAPITREEAMTVVARALELDYDSYSKTDLSKFSDRNKISNWALPYVRAMVGADYIHGRTKGLEPLDNITRAEFAQIFYNIIGTYIVSKGTYDKDIKGSVLIRTDDVELKNLTVDGDLIIGCGAADGKIVLDNVTVKGRLLVWGGGTKAVCCNNGTNMPAVVVARVDDAVKVMPFIYVSGKDVFILPLCYRVGKLFSDFMGFLIIDFPRLKRLYQMVCEVVSSVKSLRQCKSELNICRFIAAPERGHQHFPVRLVRVLDIVKGFF